MLHTQLIELSNLRIVARMICFVGGHKDRLLVAAEITIDLLVPGIEAVLNAGQENDSVGFFDSNLSLLTHLLEQTIFRDWLKSACINRQEAKTTKTGQAIVAVSRYSWNVFNNRSVTTHQPIEKRRLANIWSANNCNNCRGFRHPDSLP